MSAPTHTPGPQATAADARLHWWALALPVLAFVSLLLLLGGPAEASAADGDSPLVHTAAQLLRAVG